MSNPPRDRSGFGPWTRFARNGVFFAAPLPPLMLGLMLYGNWYRTGGA